MTEIHIAAPVSLCGKRPPVKADVPQSRVSCALLYDRPFGKKKGVLIA